MERRPYRFGHAGRVTQLVATGRDPPVVSGRWRVLGAASRRAIASRKAVPADVKDQFCVPLHSSFQRERGKVYPIPPPNASGILGIEVSRADGGEEAWCAVPPPGRRLSQLDGSAGRLAPPFIPHFKTSQWPVCLLPSRRMSFNLIKVAIARPIVSFAKSSCTARPRYVALGLATIAL